jgi:SpoVK/Ycf46/Vps4 family AAA+-type ATPase
VGPVTWNKDAFERLVLPKKTKDLVKALVMVRTSKLGEQQGMSLSGKRKRDDLIAGKGNGLIMLLHGGPGTGKTLTAESVAELAEMPLYNVTCGDIGTSADAVEKYLQTVLVLGKTWNCVLLLDEADIFLEQRSLSDLERNSLVSVFLRTLEYYGGILILTSNRVGTFDEAFKSRIQVALHYTNLDRVARKKIWKNFFDMMEADEEDVNLDELNKHMQELADQDMNGREIRNALTTARQIALFQKETLAWEHVEQAITTASVFNKYLGTVHGHTDDQYARDQEIR